MSDNKLKVRCYTIDRPMKAAPIIRVEYILQVSPRKSKEIEDYLTSIVEYLESKESRHLDEEHMHLFRVSSDR